MDKAVNDDEGRVEEEKIVYNDCNDRIQPRQTYLHDSRYMSRQYIKYI